MVELKSDPAVYQYAAIDFRQKARHREPVPGDRFDNPPLPLNNNPQDNAQ